MKIVFFNPITLTLFLRVERISY